MEVSMAEGKQYGINDTGSTGQYSESISLLVAPPPELPEPEEQPIWTQVRTKYRVTDKFIRSKAAILIMVWTLILGVLFWGDHLYTSVFLLDDLLTYPIIYFLNGLPLLFFPVAGMLADNKYGRSKTILGSLFYSLAIATIGSITMAILVLLFFYKHHISKLDLVILSYVFFVLSTPGSVGFFANNLPFGLDQLYEAPGDHQSLFIHWTIWLIYLGISINSVSWSLVMFYPTHVIGVSIRIAIPIVATICLAFLLYIARRKSHWFLVDVPRLSPYNLVYQVTKFARKHKAPLQRSAFTYHEDELPTGLDLGKQKYGGPFTTEQVEDVKVFYGILKILFCAGPFFFTDIAANPNQYIFAQHALFDNNTYWQFNKTSAGYLLEYMISDGMMTPVLIAICLPPYICFLRPLIINNHMGMLKRVGLAMILQLLSNALTLAMDIYSHHNHFKQKFPPPNCTCMFKPYHDDTADTPKLPDSEQPVFLDLKILIIQRVLVSLSYVLFQISVFELICSQSPRSMIGMLFGMAFAIRGVFNTIGSLIILPFHYLLSKCMHCYCGMFYYLFNVVVGLIALLVFGYNARKYKNRTRDEFCDYHRYAENYFARRPKKSY